MPNYNGVWSLSTQYQNADQWNSDNPLATRAIFAGGASSNVIQFVSVDTAGNTTDFGNLAANTDNLASVTSRTRYIGAGGDASGNSNVIQYVEFATTGNSSDFGNLTVARAYLEGGSNGVRGVVGGGGNAGQNVMDYVTIASTGNATDFGDLTVARDVMGAVSSAVRICFAGGDS